MDNLLRILCFTCRQKVAQHGSINATLDGELCSHCYNLVIQYERNVTTRTSKIDIEKYLKQYATKMIDADYDNGVALYEIKTPWGLRQVTLSICPSTGKQYLEFLGNNSFRNVKEALRWQWQVDKYKPIDQT